jgi:hypothetical protein
LVERKDEIDARGAQLIAIGNGHAHWAQAFIDETGIDFPVYVDPSRQSYDAFGMKRGALEGMGLRTLRHGRRARRAGFRQTATRGDPVQNGGVVVFDENGEVIYTHVEAETGDLADLDEVIAALD